MIHKDEIRSILLNLNLNLSQLVLDDFLELFNLELGADSSRSVEQFTLGNFISLYKMILVNQSTYFREIFNGKSVEDIDLQFHLRENDANCQLCFKVYDADNSGYLSFMELKTCLMEMNFHRQFARQYNP